MNTMKQKNRLDSVRTMSWFLLVLIVVELLLPATSFAGGPSQPEVQSFTPVSVSNMVDPFTGDFSYNLPLMDVEGYPVNISYNAGVSMDQEASWVGLGWNLNVGSVDRSLRGIPDDFSGDIIAKEVNMKPNRTYGIDVGADIELFGKKLKGNGKMDSGSSLSLKLGVSYNNYNGFGSNFSIGPSFDFIKSTSSDLVAGFSLSGSSENGSSFSPSLSYSKKMSDEEDKNSRMTGTIGTSFNSRAGLSYISYDVSKNKNKVHSPGKNNSSQDKMSYERKSGLSGSYSMALSTYSPSASHSMKNVSMRGKFKAGPTIIGSDVTFSVGLSYSSNWIPDEFKKMYTPSYGYLNLEKGRSNPKAILDFNRDNDASFSKYSSYIASAHLTNDIFTVKAQGISGSYKPFRTDIGYVFDPETKTISHDGSFGIEAGVGQAAKLGYDASYNKTSSYTGMWKGNSNRASDDFLFLGQESYGIVRTPFIEASESAVDQDQTFSQLGSDMSVRFDLSGSGLAPKLQDDIKNGSSTYFKNDPPNKRTEAVKRNQMMYFLTIGEVKKGMGISNVHPDLYTEAKDHHIGEITQLGTDGRRYVFGLPAYNYFQEDVTFSTGYNNSGQHLAVTSDYTGLVDYTSDENALSTSNKYGRDNYYMSETKSPYAHAFLLTSVLSDDYVDVDDVKGPSKNDLGGYVKFDYQKVANHKWRNPIEENKAYHNEGMRSDLKDDKASIVYGEKELWYVKAIESKNYVAIFTLENRADGFGVTDRHGGVLSGNPSSKLIRKISLYNKADYEANPTTAIPIQEVHFEYSYELCQGYPGNNIAGFSLPEEDTWGSGKLTLKKIYFTYQYSNKMKQSPYTFVYSTNNPPYNLKAVDRWGNYKPNSAGNEHVISSPITNSEYPYAIQDKVQADANANAWNLVRINLPSGGQIDIEYESDDYAFVQHLPAMEMCKIIGTEQDSEAIIDGSLSTPRVSSLSNDSDRNVDIIVAVDPTVTDASKFIKPKDQLAFKALMKVRNGWDGTKRSTYEYVSGYAKVKEVGFYGTTPGKLKITLEPENLKDNGDEDYNPIVKTAIQFGRMYLSETVTDGLSSPPSESTDESSFKDFANSFLEAFDSYKELFSGPNLVLWKDVTLRNILTLKSFVRLNVVDKVKLGGGHRVKRILMKDNWNTMAGGVNQTTGQEFKYINEDGTSSGVASYEPQLGGDENPWHKPFVDSKEKKRYELGTSLFVETPIMESLFPSPSVGYSRVEIKDIVVPNGALNQPIAKVRGTGKVVKEFFTAKDFPTFYSMTDMYNKTANSFLPLLPKYQYATVTQGFAIELNDMHGKPKSEKVYAEGAPLDAPLSTVEYEYLSEDVVVDGYSVKKLKNQVPTIDAQGNYQSYEMGVKREAVTDFRESTTNSIGGAMEFNVNGFVVIIPIVIPTAWPSFDVSKNSFRSASFNKVINRFGIQSTTKAMQDGASVTTSNLAYDKETGEVLVTKTQTNFKDDVYSLNYPAYWKYAQLGQAYKNQGIFTGRLNLNSNGFAIIQNASNYFVEGDEVSVSDVATGLNTKYGWVVSVSTNGINVMDKQGLPIEMLDARIKVIRSGYRNKQSTSMASLVSRTNPIPSIKTNQYKDVLNAGAVEFGQDWKTYCDCFGTTVPATTNPYVLGTKGNWRPVRSLTHLTERTQSNYNGNSNIRQDGMFMSYTPYYKMVNGKWDISPQNWTFVSEVTQFSPNGMTLETRDALNRYSATTFGFNNTLTTAVGVNTKYRQIGFASFEDAKDVKCFDKHFKFDGVSTSNLVSDSHTGKTSVRVSSTSDVKVSVTFSECAEVSCSGLGVQGTSKPETFDIVGGTAPYQIEYDVISGNAEVQLFLPNNQVGILTQGLGYHEVEYKITDANGCILIKRFSITK